MPESSRTINFLPMNRCVGIRKHSCPNMVCSLDQGGLLAITKTLPATLLGKRIAKVVEPEPKREEAQRNQKCDKDLIGESIHKETGGVEGRGSCPWQESLETFSQAQFDIVESESRLPRLSAAHILSGSAASVFTTAQGGCSQSKTQERIAHDQERNGQGDCR